MKLTTSKAHHIVIIGLLIAAVAIIAITLPRTAEQKADRSYTINQPWQHRPVYATVRVAKEPDDETLQKITDSVSRAHIPIFKRDNTQVIAQLDALDTALVHQPNVAPSVKMWISQMVRNVYETGIVGHDTYSKIQQGGLSVIRIDEGNGLTRVPTDNLFSEKSAYEWLDSVSGQKMLLRSLRIERFLTPNLIPDKSKDSTFISSDVEAILSLRGDFAAGELIVKDGDKVTPQIAKYLDTYYAELDKFNSERIGDGHPLEGRIAVVAILMIAFYIFMRLVRPRIYRQLKSIVFLLALIVLFTVVVILVVRWRPQMVYVLPFAMVPIIITTFMDSRTAFFVHMIVVLICSLAVIDPADFIILQFLAGGIAIASMQELTQRSQLVKCALFIFVAYCVGYIALEVVEGRSLRSITSIWQMWVRFGTNCVMLSFAYFGIFIVEKIFGFTSTVTLVELCDINNRTLRELSEKCPGTFQHVLQVANIAQEAALKIGANSQLVRAGALYHDIGKIDNPAFFTENQSGVNPHDNLAPEQSASIIIRHVTDGLKRAERARLPQVVCDLIAQHHGKGRVKYFYNKACQAAGEGVTVDSAPYTYPGPNPQTKEAAILMMADACEAAAKSLKDFNDDAIAEMVERIVSTQMNDGYFSEAPISFREVEIAKQVFVERLNAFYHTRISYLTDTQQQS